MRCAVRADNARAVHAQNNVQTFDCNIVNDLVIGTLQKRRVNGRYRHQSLCRHTGRHSHRMPLAMPTSKKRSG